MREQYRKRTLSRPRRYNLNLILPKELKPAALAEGPGAMSQKHLETPLFSQEIASKSSEVEILCNGWQATSQLQQLTACC